ncbi:MULTISPECIES: serine hydrolase [unclassified Mycolicibacterium]|uniref:serine hydrolase domain-containing protein n=1 Tax=unclassified Mycolicibacterium TaxID=2636767 RepID=UPI001390C3E8|nr:MULTISPECIES: serine hydrolase [unclassified Mycolicibacterium]
MIHDDNGLTLDNWLTPPHHRRGLHRVEQIVRCAAIGRGDGPVRELPTAAEPLDWDTITVAAAGGGEIGGDEYLRRTHTDGLIVLRGNEIVFERYFGDFSPTTTHIVMSISKSFCGMLSGVLAETGALDLAARVRHYLPELDGTSFGEASVEQLLDMTAAPNYDMSYLDPAAEVHAGDRAAGWRPQHPGDVAGTRVFLQQLRGAGQHGADFQYCSGTTDVLSWVLERAGGAGYRELMEGHLWSRIGAEADAFLTVDGNDTPYACAGMGMRLRDLARFGRLILDHGQRDGVSVIPAGWIAQTRRGGGFVTTAESDAAPTGTYKNQWWIPGDDHGSFYGVGIFGQYLWLDPETDVVIAKFAAEDSPVADGPESVHALGAIARAAAKTPQEV